MGKEKSNDAETVRSSDAATKKVGQPDQSHSSYHPPMLKQATSINRRTAIAISPQKKRSTKEKREFFKANTFYSKNQLSLGESDKNVNALSSDNRTAETSGVNSAVKSSAPTIPSDAAEWLSKSSGRKRQHTAGGKLPRKKRKEEVKSTVDNDAVIQAKAMMIARSMVKPYLPEPVKKPSVGKFGSSV
jgi:hypothetical protein